MDGKTLNARSVELDNMLMLEHGERCPEVLTCWYSQLELGWWAQHGDNPEHRIFYADSFWVSSKSLVELMEQRFTEMRAWLKEVDDRR